MQKVKITRKKINGANGNVYFRNVIRAGRKIVGDIWEPSCLNNYKFHVHVPLGSCYALIDNVDSFPDAILSFDKLTDGKYEFV